MVVSQPRCERCGIDLRTGRLVGIAFEIGPVVDHAAKLPRGRLRPWLRGGVVARRRPRGRWILGEVTCSCARHYFDNDCFTAANREPLSALPARCVWAAPIISHPTVVAGARRHPAGRHSGTEPREAAADDDHRWVCHGTAFRAERCGRRAPNRSAVALAKPERVWAPTRATRSATVVAASTLRMACGLQHHRMDGAYAAKRTCRSFAFGPQRVACTHVAAIEKWPG